MSSLVKQKIRKEYRVLFWTARFLKWIGLGRFFKLEQLLCSHIEFHHDSLTYLMVRRVWYTVVMQVLTDLYPEMNSIHRLRGLNGAVDYMRTKQSLLIVVFIDVAYLTLINKLGHATGDLLLTKISEWIREHELSGDIVSCRYGGDEIVLFVQGYDYPA